MQPKVLTVALVLPLLCGVVLLRLILETATVNKLLNGDRILRRNNNNNKGGNETQINETTLLFIDAAANAAAVSKLPIRRIRPSSAFDNHPVGTNITVASAVMANNNNNANTQESENIILSSWYFANHIMTTRPPRNPSCHRHCVDFRNKIYYSHGHGTRGAGLIDRLSSLSTILNMAGYLCARVYAPRPKFLLAPRHNQDNQVLSPNVSWSDFGDFKLWNDRTEQKESLMDWDDPDDPDKWPEEATMLKQFQHGELVKVSLLPRNVKIDFNDLESFSFTQQHKLMAPNNQKDVAGFVWFIQANFFEWSQLIAGQLRRRPPPTTTTTTTTTSSGVEQQRWQSAPFIFSSKKLFMGCQYANVKLTPSLEALRDTVVRPFLQQQQQHPASPALPLSAAALSTTTTTTSTMTLLWSPPLVGYLHIRRKDAWRHCNSSLEDMATYLNCSLGDAIAKLSHNALARRTAKHTNIIILYSSDEEDPNYRRGIQQLIELQQLRSLGAFRNNNNNNNNVNHQRSINVTAVDLDHMIQQALRVEMEAGTVPAWRLNNFYIFELILSIGYNQTITQFHMERRRDFACRACDNVTDQLIKSGNLDMT